MASNADTTAVGAVSESVELTPYVEMPPERRSKIDALMTTIDVAESQTIIAFGAAAQRDLTAVSEQILEGVRNKDTGPAGAALNDMMLKVRDLDVGALKNGRQPSWFERVILRRIGPLAAFLQRYETVRGQIERIQRELEDHRMKMVEDVARLDKLFEVTLDYFHDLENYIAAGVERLRRLDVEEIPALKRAAESGGDVLAAQRLSDLQTARNDLERKVHDLRLTRQVTMQGLPSIRLNQELDKSLANKIQSVLVNTLPLWKNQLAQAVALFRTREAAGTLAEVSDVTNRMLEANAENLKAANAEVRQSVEQGVFGIDSIERANRMLIETIQESLDITAEGSRRRAEAEQRLAAAEESLKAKLRDVA